MHFLEAARFPKAPVLAGRKVNFTLRPAKRPVPALAPLVEGEGGLHAVGCSTSDLHPLVTPSQFLGPEKTTLIILSYLILSYLICSHLHKNTNQTVDYMALGFMRFMRGLDITWAIGRVGPKTGETFNPTLPMAHALSFPCIKIITAKRHKKRFIGIFMQMRTDMIR